MNFCETQMGQDFFIRQIPQLIGVLQEIAAALKRPAAGTRAIDRPPDFPDTKDMENDILSDIYDCRYMPESRTYGKDDPLNEEVKKAMNALLSTLSPEQKELFLQYEDAQNARGSGISRRAYRDGVRLAVQIFMAGCPTHLQER